MATANKTFTYLQIVITIASLMIGVRLLTLPRLVANASESPNGWISSVISIVLAGIGAAVAALLARMFSDKSFFEFVPEIIGKIPGYIIATGYTVYWMLFVAHELRIMGEVVRFYLLSKTPMEVIVLIIMFAVFYLLYGGVQPLVRVQELFFPIIILIIFLLFIMLISNIEIANLQPIMGNAKGILKGVPANAFGALGYATIMIFTSYMQRPRDGLKAVLMATVLITAINTLVVLFSIGVFGYETAGKIVFPLIELVKTIELPGGFIERLESLFLTIFIMTIFSSLSIGLFLASHGIEKLYGRRIRANLPIIMSLTVFTALYPKNLDAVFEFGNLIEIIGIFYVGPLPAILFIIAKLRKLGGATQNVSIPSRQIKEKAS